MFGRGEVKKGKKMHQRSRIPESWKYELERGFICTKTCFKREVKYELWINKDYRYCCRHELWIRFCKINKYGFFMLDKILCKLNR